MNFINWTMKRVGWAVLLLVVSTASYGQSGVHCIQVNWGDDERIHLANTCDEWITFFYCGKSKYRKQQCGDGRSADQPYYTHSIVISGGDTSHVSGMETIEYAVCMGNYGFGDKGLTSDNSGNYGCHGE